MKLKIHKGLSYLLVTLLIFTGLTIPSFADENTSTEGTGNTISVSQTPSRGTGGTLTGIEITGAEVESWKLTESGDTRNYALKLAEETADDAEISVKFNCEDVIANGVTLPVVTQYNAQEDSMPSRLIMANEAAPQDRTFTTTLENGRGDIEAVYCICGNQEGLLWQGFKTYNFTFSRSGQVAEITETNVPEDNGQWLLERLLYSDKNATLITPYGKDSVQVNLTTTDAGIEVCCGTESWTTDSSGKCTITLSAAEEKTENKLELKRGDEVEATYTITCCPQLYSGMPDQVVDYICPDSQYTNGGGLGPYGLKGVATLRGGMASANSYLDEPPASLGNFGGYITYYYKDAIENNPKNPYGIDFIVFGNSVDGTNEFAEPGNVLVSEDGETWYTLAGSLHYDANAVWNQKITYVKSGNDLPYGEEYGIIKEAADLKYPTRSNYPLFSWTEELDKMMTLEGTMLRADEGTNEYGNTLPPYPGFGYADCGIMGVSNEADNPYTAHTAYGESGKTDGFDLEWAVDEDGLPVDLENKEFHYIKVQNATLIDNGAIGEKSTELNMVRTAQAADGDVGRTSAPASITVDGKQIELKDGVDTYEVNVDGIFEVAVEAAKDANIYINGTRTSELNLKEAAHGIVRVIVQEGNKAPAIYYLKIKDTSDSATDFTAVTFDADGGLLSGKTEETRYYDSDTDNTKFPVPVREGYTFLGWYVGQTKYDAYNSDFAKTFGDKATLTARWQSDSPATEPSGEKITVSFRLIGATLSETEGGVDLSTGNCDSEYVTWIKTTDYEIAKEAKVSDLIVTALEKAGLTEKGASSNYVRTITAPKSLGGYDLSELTNGQYSGWMYTINGEHPNLGVAQQGLKDGDEVVFHYVNDYRYEVSDWDKLGGEGFPALGDGTWHDGWLNAEDTDPPSEEEPSDNPPEPAKPDPGQTGGTEDASAVLKAFKAKTPVVSLKNQTRTSIKVSWKKVKDADGYAIYRSTKKNKGYKKVKTINSGRKLSWIDKKKKTGSKYYYKVRAWQKDGTGTAWTKSSKAKGLTAKVQAPSVKYKTRAGVVRASWKKVTGADRYQIYRATKQKGRYKKIATTKKRTFRDTKVRKGRAYYYKVRAVDKVKGKTLHSSFSKTKKIKAR